MDKIWGVNDLSQNCPCSPQSSSDTLASMSDMVMIQELRKKRDELQAERGAIDAKLAAISTVIDMFEGMDESGDRKALTSRTSRNEHQMSGVPESSSPTKTEGRSQTSPESEGSSTNGHPKKLSIAQEVREAVLEFEGQFKTQDVVHRIKTKHPQAEVTPTPVSTALGRMVHRKEGIRVAREGEAWEPNIYERVSHDNSTQENLIAEGSSVNG